MTASRATGFTLVEALMAVVLMAATVATMSMALGHVRMVSEVTDDAAIADYLLCDGIARARLLPRTGEASKAQEPDDAAVVEDLGGLAETGPVDLVGNTFPSEWKRSWTVEHADLDAPANNAAASATTLLRVLVTVSKNGEPAATETFLLSKTP